MCGGERSYRQRTGRQENNGPKKKKFDSSPFASMRLLKRPQKIVLYIRCGLRCEGRVRSGNGKGSRCNGLSSDRLAQIQMPRRQFVLRNGYCAITANQNRHGRGVLSPWPFDRGETSGWHTPSPHQRVTTAKTIPSLFTQSHRKYNVRFILYTRCVRSVTVHYVFIRLLPGILIVSLRTGEKKNCN